MIIFVLKLKDAECNIFKVGSVDAGKPIDETRNLSQALKIIGSKVKNEVD